MGAFAIPGIKPLSDRDNRCDRNTVKAERLMFSGISELRSAMNAQLLNARVFKVTAFMRSVSTVTA
jgi:hypothetical protein